MTETARDSKVNIVKKEANLRAASAFLGTDSDVDMRTCYRCGEKGLYPRTAQIDQSLAGSQRHCTMVGT